jgi:hypothetical protein
VAKLTGRRLLWHRHTKTYFLIWQVLWVWKVATLRSSLCMYVCLCVCVCVCVCVSYTIFFLLAYFVDSSPKVNFQIALIFSSCNYFQTSCKNMLYRQVTFFIHI